MSEIKVIRCKFKEIYTENVVDQDPNWEWVGINNLKNMDGKFCELRPKVEPYVSNQKASTIYKAPRIVLKGIDKQIPNTLAEGILPQYGGYGIQLMSKYKWNNYPNFLINGNPIYFYWPDGTKSDNYGNLAPFPEDPRIGKSGGPSRDYLNDILFPPGGIFKSEPGLRYISYEDLNNPEMKFELDFSFAFNGYDSSIDGYFGFDIFYLDIYWLDKKGSFTTNFVDVANVPRSTKSTVKPTARNLAGFSWIDISNALEDNESSDNWAISRYSSATPYIFDHTSTDIRPGLDKFYYTDYLHFKNLNFKVPSTILDLEGNVQNINLLGMAFRFKKRGFTKQFVQSGKTRIAQIRFYDDVVIPYNGSSFIGANNLFSKDIPLENRDPNPWRDNLGILTDFGTIPDNRLSGSLRIDGQIYGGSSDNWNISTFSAATLNNSNFGIAVAGYGFFTWWEYINANHFPYDFGIDYADLSVYFELYKIIDYISVFEGVYDAEDSLTNQHEIKSTKANITGIITYLSVINNSHKIIDRKLFEFLNIVSSESFNKPTLDIFGKFIIRNLKNEELLSNTHLINKIALINQNPINIIESLSNAKLKTNYFFNQSSIIEDSNTSNLLELKKNTIIKPSSINTEENFRKTFLNNPTIPSKWIEDVKISSSEEKISNDALVYDSSQSISGVNDFLTYENVEYDGSSDSINYNWLMPENASSFSDGIYSEIAWVNDSSTEPNQSSGYINTDYIIAKGILSDPLPNDAIITGITIFVNKLGSNLDLNGFRTEDLEVKLTLNASYIGDNKAKVGENWPTLLDGFKVSTYGSTSDKWGLNLTANDINDPSFGVAIRAKFKYKNLSGSDLIPFLALDKYKVWIEYIGITITYRMPIPNIEPSSIISSENISNSTKIIVQDVPAEGCLKFNFDQFENQAYVEDGDLTARYIWENQTGARQKDDGSSAYLDKDEP